MNSGQFVEFIPGHPFWALQGHFRGDIPNWPVRIQNRVPKSTLYIASTSVHTQLIIGLDFIPERKIVWGISITTILNYVRDWPVFVAGERILTTQRSSR